MIQNLTGEVRRAVTRGDLAGAAQHLQRLVPVLAVHDAVEEVGIYPAMAQVAVVGEKVDILYDEHDELDTVLDRAVGALRSSGPESVDWPSVLTAFETLWEHIDHEENGMFPAAAIALDAEDWERAEQVRADVQSGRIQPHQH